MESTQFDAAAERLSALVAELGGWFESSRLDNGQQNYRRAYYTVRVPAEKFDAFCDTVGDLCKLSSIHRSSEDVSERYYDTESRLATQRTKLSRLQELLAKAENMEDIITLESAIADTELAIENLTGSLRKYDSLVNYATVSVTLAEVYQLSQTEEPAIGFGAKLAAAFASGSSSFVEDMQDLLLDMARNWAGVLLFLAVVALIIFVVVRIRRKNAAARAAGVYPPPKPQRQPRRSKDAATAERTPVEQPGDKKKPD